MLLAFEFFYPDKLRRVSRKFHFADIYARKVFVRLIVKHNEKLFSQSFLKKLTVFPLRVGYEQEAVKELHVWLG